jgi:glycerol uptake facilitator-like aquaporin
MAHISKAHLNPAVTCSLVVIGDLNIPLAGIYMVSQVIGATLGYGVLLVSQSTLQPINTTVWSSLKL